MPRLKIIAPSTPADAKGLLKAAIRDVVEEGPRTGGWSGEVLAAIVEAALDDLDDAWRLTTADHPIPYSPTLEDAFLPLPHAIVTNVRERLGARATRPLDRAAAASG